MKKLISFLLAIVMTVSLAMPVFAEEAENPQYGIIRFEFSDTPGSIENLDVMVLDGFVYTNVESFCSRMGYDVEQGETSDGEIRVSVSAFSDLWMDDMPTLELQFVVDDTTVYYKPLCGIEIAYTTPAPCVQNERGTWIPLSYTLNLLGGSRNIAGDVLVIHRPSPNILSVAAVIAKNTSLLSFDWTEDFGYSEIATGVTDGAARVVTLFSGLIEFDGRSWSSFIDWNAFDKKFGKSLAAMMCTHSEDELQEYIEDVEGMLDVFDPEGAIGAILHSQQTTIDGDVNAWEKICEEELAQLQSGSGTLPQYNMAYQQYERATKKQDLFSAIGADDVISIQDGLAEATNALKYATWIGYGVTYLDEFQQRDDFQATVLKNYFATRRKTEELDDATARAIENYVSSGLIEYSLRKFFEEHALEVVVDESGMDALMGIPANLLLLAWDIMSENIPFYSDGLKSVEAREISNYAQQVQNDASVNVSELLQSMRTDSASITPEDCVRLAEYCYVYLKACSIARDFAIDSLKDISEEAQQKLQSKINAETDINQYIAEYLAILGQANVGNSCYILGFLPQNNKELLGMYSDDDLVNGVVEVNAENETMKRKLTQISVKDSDGNVTAQYEFQYNENGRMVGVINDDYQLETESKTVLFYDGDRLIRKTSGFTDVHYTYDSDGLLIRMYSQDGLRETLYEYNSDRKLILETSRYDIGSEVTEYSYNSDGLLARTEATCTEMDDFIEKEVTTYSYDTQRRLIETVSVNGDSQTRSSYSYDLTGELISVHRSGENFEEQKSYIEPFVIIEYDNVSTNYQSLSLVIENDAGDEVYSFYCQNPKLLYDSEGYLAQVVSIGKGVEQNIQIYEFYYDDVKAQVKLSEDAMVDAYMKVLLQYPEGAEYTLYDIDKDGLSELIVQSEGYSVYTFNKLDAVLCGSCYPYHDGLYIFDGNGMIVHHGGSGRLHFEYVTLYKLSDNILVDEEIVSTEEASYDEIDDYLSEYSKIADFYSVSDYSLLERKLA